MSLKDLFGKKSSKPLVSTNIENTALDIESPDYLVEELEERKLIKPDVDYSDPKNFAFFGSAKKYYEDAIQNIAKKYPYDGSGAEKLKWKKNTSDLENYIFENEYPRNNGYINLGVNYGTTVAISSDGYSKLSNNEFIFIKGGPNTSENNTNLSSLFGTSNIVDAEDNRESNLLLDGNNGVTVEFWYKKNNISGSSKQVIFDLWNSASLGSSHGRFLIEIHPGVVGEEDKFYVNFLSGSDGATSVALGNGLSLYNTDWQHFSITAQNTGSNIEFKLFRNGDPQDRVIAGTNVGRVYGPMLGYIGSLGTTVQGGNASLGYGKLSGSLDEFRYWKTKRSEKDISRYWFTQVNGGTNTDLANTDLGIYYKFNEGIYNTSSIDTKYDNKVLDYSGRFSNGYWYGYSLNSRSTGSAMVESSAADFEHKDPIIYLTHPLVQSLLQEKQELGTLHDNSNNSLIYYTIPAWIVEGDQENDSNKLYELTQIIGSYFDDLFIKIKHLSLLKQSNYTNGRPLPYAMKLLESVGFTTQNLFTNSTILENIGNRTEDKLYEERLFDIKNHIYQNIYNNLSYIQKSKGTEKSIRNLLRCFGIDEELIKLNIYSNDSIYTFNNKYVNSYYKKKLINFNDSDRFQGTIYQYKIASQPDSYSYINGNETLGYYGSTLEAEIIVPKKFSESDKTYFNTYFVTSSIIGMHSANSADEYDTTWYGGDFADLEIYLVKQELNSKNAYFLVKSNYMGFELTSSLVYDIYSDTKWNISSRLKHEKYPNSIKVTGAETGDFIFEFYAINSELDSIQNEIKITAIIPESIAKNHFISNKRIYAGSHRNNFTGSILHNSDIKLSDIKYWTSYVDDNVLKERAKNSLLFGQNNPVSKLETLNSEQMIQNATLVLHWNFYSVTGSDNGTGIGPTNSYDGKFNINNFSNYLTDINSCFEGLEFLGKNYTGVGNFFFRNNSDMVENSYLPSAKHRLPENINSSDLINILTEDDQTFTKDSYPLNHYFILEKSMYQTISEEMLKFFGTITEFNNIIGRPKYKFEQSYKELNLLRNLFFQRVNNTPDLEKYVDYFKWIDESVTKMVYQLVPASAEFSENVSNIIESHIFERNKYTWKLPTLELGTEPPIGIVNTIGELKYNWKFGHAPIPLKENTNCIWWKERTERNEPINKIFEVLSTEYKRKLTRVAHLDININSIVNKNPSNVDVIKPLTKIGSGEYLELDVLKLIEKKDCIDE